MMFPKDLPAYLRNAPALDAAEIAEIINCIPRPPREDWVKIIAACVAALGESEALRVLTAHFPDEKKNETAAVIRSLHGAPRSDAGTLIYYAQQNGFDASAFFKARAARLKEAAGMPAHAPRRDETAANAPRKEKHDTQAASAAESPQNAAQGAKPPATLPETESVPARAARPRKEKTDTLAHAPAANAQPLPPVRLGKCSICAAANRPETMRETDLNAVLSAIKAGRWKEKISAVRAGKLAKTALPQITAFGVYHGGRKDEDLIARSGFFVLDFDGKDNPQTDFARLRARLARLPFVAAVFTSPSGNGLKAIIRGADGVDFSANMQAAAAVLRPLAAKIDMQANAGKHFFASADADAFISPVPLAEIPPLAPVEDLPPAALAALFADTMENFFFAGKESYYFRDGETIKELSVAAAAQEFEVRHGVSRTTARRALYAVRAERYVERAFPALACIPAGNHALDGSPVLVLKSPRVIEADEGQFPKIKKLLETVFAGDNEQLTRFLAWLKIARAAFLRAVDSRGRVITPVPVLELLGTRGSGKDLLFLSLIRPALGNRNHAAANTFPQEKQWLGAIVGAECILGSEIQKLTADERDRYAQTCKRIIGGSGYDAEGKGKDSFTIHLQHFIIILANIDEGGNCAASCPALDEDFRDKCIALSLANAAAVKAAFPTKDKEANAAAIRKELPAFLYWLEVNFDFPAEWKDERFGVKGFVSPAAARALFEVSAAATVDEKLQYAAANAPAETVERQLSAAEIGKILERYFSDRVKSTVWLGKIMRELCRDYPEKYVWNGSNSAPRYTIRRPRMTEDAAAASAETLAGAFPSPLAGLPF